MRKNNNVRQELAQLGKSWPSPLYRLIQSFLTWLSGQPYPGQTPLIKSNPLYELGTGLTTLFGSVGFSTFILQSPPLCLPLLLISWAITVGSARKLLTCVMHRCVHHQFFGDHRDRWLGEVISTLLMLQDYEGYQHDHCKKHHHIKFFTTFEQDPDAQFVLALGFFPGLNNSNT